MNKKKTRIRNNNPVVTWAVISLVLVLAVATLMLIREYIAKDDNQLTSTTSYLDKTPDD